jgi:nucleoredoxin
VTLSASDLSEESATRLNDWQAPAAAIEAKPSVFDSILDGNLERLDVKRLKKCDQATKPAKYYVFYYTASWCGPCQEFTPSLVEWYQANKNDNFELVLITSDSDDQSMEQYAVDKKMPWPQLKLRKVQDFKKKFQHGVAGIPSVIVCDLEGKNLGNFRSNLAGVTQLVKD